MDDKTFNLKGETEIPVLNLPLSDLWIVLPGVFAFNMVSSLAALGRFAPLLGLVALVLLAFLGRQVLVWWRRIFPGKALAQLITWYGQADRFEPGRDRRTYRVK